MSSTISRKARLARQMRDREAMDARGILGDVPLGVDQRMEMAAGGQVVLQFQRGDLDHPVTELRLQARGFRVEQNGAGQARTSLISRLSVRSEWWRDNPVLHDDIGPAPLLGVRHLARDHRRDVRGVHPPAPADALYLHRSWGGDDNHAIDPRVAAGLEQQGDVQHHGALAPAPGAGDEGPLLLLDHRMQDAFEPGERIRIAEHRLTQRHAVHGSVPHRAGKRRLDRPDGPPATRLQPVHRGIGIEHGNARPAERGRGGRLAHADPTGKAKDDHRIGRSAATKRRNASSTSGSTPNQAWKPGTA